jgi:hypothetical protein
MKTCLDTRGVGRLVGGAARLALLAVLALCVASCGSSGSGGGGSALIRVFNAVVDGGPITVTVGTQAAATALPFEGLTPYRTVNGGSQELKVVPAGGGSPIVDTTVVLNGSTSYSYILFGTASTPIAQLIQDGVATLTTGQFGLRLTNAAIGSSPIDVYVTTPGASLDGLSPNINNVLVSNTSAFVALTAGTYQVRFTLHNSKQVTYDAGTLTFGNGISYALVAYSKASGTLVNAALLVMDTNGNGALANSLISEFKLVHAAPLTPAINARVNGTVAFANVPYQGITSYGTLGVGTQTVTIEVAATPGAVIASAQPPFSPATDTSIVVTGLPGAQTALVFADNNLPGTTGSARMRVINVAPGLGAVDVLINFAKRVSGLATNAASSYIELVEDTYIVNFDLADTTTIVLNMPAVSVTAGRTYTLYLMGTPGALTGVLTRDD